LTSSILSPINLIPKCAIEYACPKCGHFNSKKKQQNIPQFDAMSEPRSESSSPTSRNYPNMQQQNSPLKEEAAEHLDRTRSDDDKFKLIPPAEDSSSVKLFETDASKRKK
jgi:hypothetical protein